jgi:hypothetical protein
LIILVPSCGELAALLFVQVSAEPLSPTIHKYTNVKFKEWILEKKNIRQDLEEKQMASFFIRAAALVGRFRSGAAALVCDMRWSYVPPLMVYFAAGVSGFTGIIEAFFVKEKLGMSATMLASLGFWAGLPWAMKMPVGHLVDRFWHRKALFVYLGASLMAASLLIMVGLTGHAVWMATMLPLDTWYIVAVLLAPIGFVLQDVVADAMTVEAVPAQSRRRHLKGRSPR